MAIKLPEVPAGTCFHCLQALPADGGYSVRLADQDVAVCCYGCQAVAQTINEQKLLHFYVYRDTTNPLQIPLLPEELQQLQAYDDERLQAQFTRTTDQGRQREMTLSVEGMTCSACAWLIEHHVQRLAGVASVKVNATTERVYISWYAGQIKLSRILQAIAGLGYRALPFESATQEQDFKKRRRYYVRRLGLAGLATMQVMMIAVGLYFGVVSDLDDSLRQFMWWISLVVATPVLLYSAQPFYISAMRSIQAQRPNMDVPVSIALLGAYGASAYATFLGHGEVYFESVSMFTFLLLIGRYLELLARQKAISAATNLIKLVPALAQRETARDDIETVPVSDLSPGQIIRVAPGATLPADGILLDHSATLNEAILTGESRPVQKPAGTTVLAGSINQQQPLRIEVTAAQQETVLASIVALKDLALSRKPRLAQAAEKLASTFVIRLLIVAAITFLVWSFIDPQQAFWVTLAVLVATCPCALALAAPTAVTGAIHNLNTRGVVLRNADVLNIIQDIKTVFVDKTGTLTTGEFSLQHEHIISGRFSEDTIRALVQALEHHSEHPLAQPLRQLTATPANVSAVVNHTGQGLSGVWAQDNESLNVRIGSLSFIRQWHPEFTPATAASQIFVATEQDLLAEYHVGDQIRSDARASIEQLQQAGIEVVMLTGDRAELAQPVAEQLGISKVYADSLPDTKLSVVSAAQQQHPVMMIGDGINDGPVLAQADISITFGHAADLARVTADVMLMRNNFGAVLEFRQVALRSRGILRQNIIWALVYNIGILPVAMAGFVTPYIAAIGMSLSSLIVLANSLRLYR
ncbi:heavy metal translocating P-type ATPase [Pseudidiomarina sp.]|uniref:heavy metal translocating P-type ATPase n=1 Tax=Pseudidiomarina sp. TaxID=2081707 RepID=UPI00299EE2AA|nr:heavy metal translocating P-type ATPase [Pseudidiomarina sp.]MDX1704988.1 heavy metal translocating P-type ATPase [Pseudidiomarina sp.]